MWIGLTETTTYFEALFLTPPRFVVASAFNNSSSIPLLNKLNKIITFSFVRIDNRQAFQVRSFRREAGGSTSLRSNNDSNKNRKETGLDWQNNGFTHASRLFCTFISLPSLHNNDVKLPYFTFCGQCAKKVVSHSLGLVDFAIGLVCSVFKLPDGQLKFFGEIKSQRTVIKPADHATGS